MTIDEKAIDAACAALLAWWNSPGVTEEQRDIWRKNVRTLILAYEANRSGEPVGYLFEVKYSNDRWSGRMFAEDISQIPADEIRNITPLFAAPPKQDTADVRDALRRFDCPRPCNNRPDDFTAGQCVDAGECGCMTAEVQAAVKSPSSNEGGVG